MWFVRFDKNAKNSIQQVKGYQTGSVLQKLEQNLMPYDVEYLNPRVFVFNPVEGLKISVQESVRPLFLGYIATTEFSTNGEILQLESHYYSEIPISQRIPPSNRIQIQSTFECHFHIGGWLKKKGIYIKSTGDHQLKAPFLLHYSKHPELTEMLEKIDFSYAKLMIKSNQWQFKIQHFAASEVSGKVPPLKRYLQLKPEQIHALLSCFLMMQQLMGNLNSP